jgi:hypothetical protein
MRVPRYRDKIDWQTFVLIFVISLILYLLPYLKELLIITAIAVVFYLFIKSLY